MCFTADYEYPQVGKVTRYTSRVQSRCCECAAIIHAGEGVKEIYLQEYQLCTECDGTDFECEHNFGYRDIFHQCERCDRLIEVISKIEEERGCHNIYPSVGGLFSEVDDWDSYINDALRLGLPIVDFPNHTSDDASDYFEQLVDEYDGAFCVNVFNGEVADFGGES